MMNHPFLYLLKQRKIRITTAMMCLLILQSIQLSAFKKVPLPTSVILTNTQPLYRIHEAVSIHRNQFHNLAGNLFPIIKNQGRIYITQFVYDNGDAKWGRLLMEATVMANNTSTLQVNRVGKKQLPEFKTYTNIRLSLHLVGYMPNGVTSNVIAFIAKANLPFLSVTINAVSTLVTPIRTTLLMNFWGASLHRSTL